MPEIPENITFYWTEDKYAKVSTQEFLQRYRQDFARWRLDNEIADYDASDFEQFLEELIENNDDIAHEFGEETDSFHSYEVELSRY